MKILIIIGTRPEGIKFAPLVRALKSDPYFEVKVCVTGQHKEMLQQVLDFFEISADYDLELMKPNQTLFDLSANCLLKLKSILDDFEPHLVFVQGDTTTAFIGALAAYYKKVKVAHLEAGLRSGNLFSPFPEEGNRKLIGTIGTYHFAPTKRSQEALNKENINKNVWVVGNTVIDALLLGLKTLKEKGINYSSEFPFIDHQKKLVLVTAHRRESFGAPLADICTSIIKARDKYPNIYFLYPVHYNPNVRETVFKMLSNQDRIHLIDPVDYPRLIWLMNKAHFIMTDSGGIQEEAPTLGKPVLVLRDVTERVDGVEAKTARLVGTDQHKILAALSELLADPERYEEMSKASNPYGDGTTSEKIVQILKSQED